MVALVARKATVAAIGIVFALVVSACTFPSHNDYMVDLDGMSFGVSYTNFKWYTANDAAQGRKYYPFLDWTPTSPACSAPLVGDGIWDFSQPCIRHDFMYGSLTNADALYSDPDVWTGGNKNAADFRFKSDLYARCGDWAWYLEGICQIDANAYFVVVNLIPPYGLHTGSFEWTNNP